MHSNVTITIVSWPHFSWPTLYNSSERRKMRVVSRQELMTQRRGQNKSFLPTHYDPQTSKRTNKVTAPSLKKTAGETA